MWQIQIPPRACLHMLVHINQINLSDCCPPWPSSSLILVSSLDALDRLLQHSWSACKMLKWCTVKRVGQMRMYSRGGCWFTCVCDLTSCCCMLLGGTGRAGWRARRRRTNKCDGWQSVVLQGKTAAGDGDVHAQATPRGGSACTPLLIQRNRSRRQLSLRRALCCDTPPWGCVALALQPWSSSLPLRQQEGGKGTGGETGGAGGRWWVNLERKGRRMKQRGN